MKNDGHYKHHGYYDDLFKIIDGRVHIYDAFLGQFVPNLKPMYVSDLEETQIIEMECEDGKVIPMYMEMNAPQYHQKVEVLGKFEPVDIWTGLPYSQLEVSEYLPPTPDEELLELNEDISDLEDDLVRFEAKFDEALNKLQSLVSKRNNLREELEDCE
jgi:hypothetical protein